MESIKKLPTIKEPKPKKNIWKIIAIILIIIGIGFGGYKKYIYIYDIAYDQGLVDLSIDMNNRGYFPLWNNNTQQFQQVALETICGVES